ncbi:hypothetical protein RC74_18610 [Falsihalocynthiibacter arcticus]|uniref:Uncharacterized protein n=1 Tax=Falsihalocynthiibacter arcticus TaxID=1579316 RepID=A0A126V5L1_9RHOB|nr:hypothetical protein RC74_18610 [Falsihalocynthiibacter arcticus]
MGTKLCPPVSKGVRDRASRVLSLLNLCLAIRLEYIMTIENLGMGINLSSRGQISNKKMMMPHHGRFQSDFKSAGVDQK